MVKWCLKRALNICAATPNKGILNNIYIININKLTINLFLVPFIAQL